MAINPGTSVVATQDNRYKAVVPVDIKNAVGDPSVVSAYAQVVVIDGSSTFSSTVVGNVASGAADSGNPVKVGGVYNSTVPTFATGQRGDLQLGSRGALRTQLMLPDNNLNNSAQSNASDAFSNVINAINVGSFGMVYNGSTWDRARGDVSGQVNQPHAMTGNRIQYAAAAGGITNTTVAVTMFAAAGAGVRNYITGLQIEADALGAATELAIRDGAAGTVIWRTKIGTAGLLSGRDIVFPVPLKGSVDRLMEVVTLTASVTGSVYVDAQGYTGA